MPGIFILLFLNLFLLYLYLVCIIANFGFVSQNKHAMYQIIHETIAVAGVYKDRSFFPKKFLWNKKLFTISQITMVVDSMDGGVKYRRYSAEVRGNLYRLLFNRQDETWKLEAIWCE